MFTSVEEQIQTLKAGCSVKGRNLGWNIAFPKLSRHDNVAYYRLMSSWGQSWIFLKAQDNRRKLLRTGRKANIISGGSGDLQALQLHLDSREGGGADEPGNHFQTWRARRCLGLVSMDFWRRNARSTGWSSTMRLLAWWLRGGQRMLLTVALARPSMPFSIKSSLLKYGLDKRVVRWTER